jgi:hypothetical protein
MLCRRELATSADDADLTKDEGIYPAGAAMKAMPSADGDREEEGGKVEDEFGDGDASVFV